MNLINVSAGILLVFPDPPIPSKILIFELEKLYFCFASFILFISKFISGLLSTSSFIFLFKNS